MFLLFLSLFIIGIAGYVLFADLWIRYVFAHIGGLGIIGLFACWAGAIAKKKGRGYWGAFFLGLVTPIMLGTSSVGVVHTLGGHGCGGIVSLSVAIVIILSYYLVKKRTALIVGFFVLAAASGLSPQHNTVKLTGPYLRQKPPGLTPEVFAPGIVSKEGDQARLFIAPDGSEIIYWEREPVNGRMRIISIRNAGGVWSEPAVLPFSEEYRNMEPCLSPDGKKMFFVSDRPLSGQGEGEKFPNIWMVEKNAGTWGEPRILGDPVNRLDIVVQPFYTVDDKLYFCGENADRSSGGMYVSQYNGNGFSEPVRFEGDISSGQFSGPCVSPDNRMLVLHARKDGGRFRKGDLYVSFRDAGGDWGELVNLGEAINTEEEEHGATFSPDGRYLFFSRAGDIYWISTEIIEELRPKQDPNKNS